MPVANILMTQCLELPEQHAFMSPDHQEASGLRALRETQQEANQKLRDKGGDSMERCTQTNKKNKPDLFSLVALQSPSCTVSRVLAATASTAVGRLVYAQFITQRN